MKKRIISGVVSAAFLLTSAMPANAVDAVIGLGAGDIAAKSEEPVIVGSEAETEIIGELMSSAEIADEPDADVFDEAAATAEAEMVAAVRRELTITADSDKNVMETVGLGDNIKGTLYEGGELVISGYGEMTIRGEKSPFEAVEFIRSVRFTEPEAANGKYITNICDNLFNGAERLEKVYLTDHITYIGNGAFEGCSKLNYLIYSEESGTDKAFSLPKGLTYVGDLAFRGCSSAPFGSLEFPETLEIIGTGAFACCNGIKKVNVPGTVKRIGSRAFSGCESMTDAVIGDGVQEIGYYVFEVCFGLRSLTLPYAGHEPELTNTSEPISATFFNESMSDYKSEMFRADEIVPKTLTKITITGGTIVPDYSFAGMSSLTEVKLPDTITYIGDRAFDGCTNLESFPFTAEFDRIGRLAFRNCGASNESFKLPESVRIIGEGAFAMCSGLKNIVVPSSVYRVGSRAFSGCENLREAVISDDVNEIGYYVFEVCSSLNHLTLPYAGLSERDIPTEPLAAVLFNEPMNSDEEHLDMYVPERLEHITITGGTIIPDKAFVGMTALQRVDLPDSITSIGSLAFKGCSNITSFSITGKEESPEGELRLPKSLERIGMGAFAMCSGIKKVNISGKVEIIGSRAFSGCENMTEAVIGENVREIGNYVFEMCKGLRSLTLPYAGHEPELTYNSDPISATFFNASMFDHKDSSFNAEELVPKALTKITITGGNMVPDYSFAGMKDLEEVDLPDSVTYIGESAFKDCSGIENFRMPVRIERIGELAFKGCGIKSDSLYFPPSLEIIDGAAFAMCGGLEKVVIPGTVKRVGGSAFFGCDNLREAVIGDGVEEIGYYVFSRCHSLTHLTLPYVGLNANEPLTEPLAAVMFDAYVNPDEEHLDMCVPESLDRITITGGTNIPDKAFMGMSNITTIDLPDSITSVGNLAFKGCTSLEHFNITGREESPAGELRLPASLERIGMGAFAMCSGIETVDVCGNVKMIGGRAFSGCENLKTAVIEDGVEEIGYYAFEMCNSLRELTLPFAGITKDLDPNDGPLVASLFNESMINYREEMFDGSECTPKSLRVINITGGASIPKYSFRGMSQLEEVMIPSSVNTIGMDAFSGCTSLASVQFAADKSKAAEIRVLERNDAFDSAEKSYNCVKILVQPHDITVKKGETARFHAYAAGDVEYLWGMKKGETAGVTTDKNGVSSTYSFTADTDKNGCYFLASVKSGMDTESAKLTVVDAYVSGDANGDGVFDLSDIAAVQEWLLGSNKNLPNWEAADLCRDGVIDVYDLCMMKTELSKLGK